MTSQFDLRPKTIPFELSSIWLLAAFVISACAVPPLQQTKLVAGDRQPDDFFGYSVALSDQTALVGAYKDDNKRGIDAGAAYVFVSSSNGWQQQAKLTAIDGARDDTFGGNVALDDNLAAIGSRGDDDLGEDSGSVYLFLRKHYTWSPQGKVIAADGAAGDAFGQSVAISSDYLVVGAPHDDDFGDSSGSAYVYKRKNGTWHQEAKLTASDGSEGDVFGISVSISGDTILVGADLDDEIADNAGAAYVYTRSKNDGWMEQTKLTAADGSETDLFGVRVAISGDTALISARRDDDERMGEDAGSVYVFARTDEEWHQQAKLTAPDGAANDRFGRSVAIIEDTALIGAMFTDDAGENSGSAYLFGRSENSWTVRAKLVANDATSDDVFGWSVAIAQDLIIVGSSRHAAGASQAGAAYIFDAPFGN